MKSYDRQDGETTKAYAAFCLYRDMGASRSIASTAAEFYTGQLPDNRPKGNIRRIERWSSQWHWVDRCRDYDRDEEAIARERIRARRIEEHDRELEEFRQSNTIMGRALLAISSRMLTLANLMARQLETKTEFAPSDFDNFAKLQAGVKALANFATIGGDLTADGLLVKQLLQHIKENELSE